MMLFDFGGRFLAKTLSEISKLLFCKPAKFWFFSSLSQTLSLGKLSLKTPPFWFFRLPPSPPPTPLFSVANSAASLPYSVNHDTCTNKPSLSLLGQKE